MADEQSAVASSSNEPSLPAVTAAPSAPAREMRQRPAAPKKLLESGGPEPAGKAKQRKPVKKKKTTTAVASKKKGKAAAASTAKAAAPVLPAEEAGLSDLSGFLDTTAATLDGGEDAVDDNALFCICLGKDDGRPMIMCEGCENWYHLECIGITEQQAELIASYFCQLCEHAGSGKTEWLPEPPAPAATTPIPVPIPIPIPAAPLTPSDSGGEYEDRDYFDSKRRGGGAGDSDDDYSESGKRRRKRESATHQARKPSISSGKKRKVIEDDDDREEKEAGKSKKTNKDSISETTFYDRPAAPAKRGSMTGVRTSTPATNKTRRHCLETLENLLSGIVDWSATEAFTSSFTSVPSDTLLTTAQIGSLAEDIEDNLYDNFGEIDPARNEKIAKAKYIAKFRTLQFNLKANDYFKSRIVTRSLAAEEVVAMAPENLLTPEARAEQEAIKQQSLAMSVKIATDKPKTRMTHKGEEVLDEFDAAGTGSANKQQDDEAAQVREGSEQRSREQSEDFNSFLLRDQEESGREDSFAIPADQSDRERSMSMSMPQASPRLEQLQQSPRVASPSAMSPQPYEDTRSPVRGTFSPVDNFAKPSSRRQSMAAPLDSPSIKQDPSASPADNSASRPNLPHHSRSDSIKAKLDLDSIWGAYKSPTTPTVLAESPSIPKSTVPDVVDKERKSEDDMETESDDDRPDKAKPEKKEEEEEEDDAKEQAEDYDPFATIGKSTADEDFDAIMGDDADTKKPDVAAATTSLQGDKDPFEALPTVWRGTLSNPPEEVFPARIVQIGGSNLGSHPHIWDQVLPKDAINVSARIDLKTASEYLVQIRFASTRELIVLAIVPENEANFVETAAATAKPSMETIAKYSAFRNTLTDKKRFGVCPPSADLKNRVKDHYIVPLRKNDPLPDYIELLDEHIIPETGSRTKDYLLCVLVLKKGLAGDKAPPLSANLPAGTSTTAPAHSTVAPQQPPPQSAASQSQGIPGLTQQSQALSFATSMGQAGGAQLGSAGFPPGMGPGLAPQVQAGMNGQQPPGVPGLDPSLLQGLLSNPGLLQALGSNGNPGGQMSPPAQQPGFPAGGFMPQQGGFPMNQAPFGMPGQMPPQMQMQMPQGSPGWQQQQHPPFGMPSSQWGNPAGSPPWQGGPPPPNPGWGPPGPMHGSQLPLNHPGYIDPERIRMASAEARELGMRAGNRGGRPDDRRDGWRDDRRDDRRSPRASYPPRDSDRDRDRDRGRDRDRDSRDRDWGRNRDMRDRDRERDDWNRDRDRGRGRDERRDDPRAGRRNSDYANRDRDSGSPRDRPGSNNQMRAGIQDKGWGRRA